MNRRTFLTTTAVSSTALTTSVAAADPPESPSPAPGYNYRLPAFPTASRLLFIGDSITDMKWGRNENDRNHYLGHSYVYLIASRLGVDMPQAKLEFFNRGISGNKVGQLKQRWQKDAIDMKPDLLSVLIGVNDVSQNRGNPVALGQWEADYRHILTESRKDNPDLRIVLLDPFVLASGRLADNDQWSSWRGEVDKLRTIVTRLAGEFDAVHITTQETFDHAAAEVSPEQWIWDGVHPLPQGHELIARHWLRDVSARWH